MSRERRWAIKQFQWPIIEINSATYSTYAVDEENFSQIFIRHLQISSELSDLYQNYCLNQQLSIVPHSMISIVLVSMARRLASKIVSLLDYGYHQNDHQALHC